MTLPGFKVYEAFETMTRYTGFVNSPTILGVLSTIEAYRHCVGWIDDLCSYLYDNLKYTENYIQKHMSRLKFQVPEGCYFAWIDFHGLDIVDTQMQQFLIHEGKVAIMSGTVYGARQYLRFHVGCLRSKVEGGLCRLKKIYNAIERLK